MGSRGSTAAAAGSSGQHHGKAAGGVALGAERKYFIIFQKIFQFSPAHPHQEAAQLQLLGVAVLQLKIFHHNEAFRPMRAQ